MNIVYRQKFHSDTWHWVKSCTNYPDNDYEEVSLIFNERPKNGELCDQCIAKELARHSESER